MSGLEDAQRASDAETGRVLSAILQSVLAVQRTGDNADAGVAFVREYAPEFATAAMQGPAAVVQVATSLATQTGGALFCVVQIAAQRLGEDPVDMLTDLVRLYRRAGRGQLNT